MIEAGGTAANASEAAEKLIAADDLGTIGWWQRIAASGTPLVERIGNDRARVTFLYRDGSPATDRVYIDVNGVTDHHSPTPQTLERIAGSDVWLWQVSLPSDWRGSYAFIPAAAADRPPPPNGTAAEQQRRHREWWGRIAATARPDPLNHLRSHPSGWGGKASPLHLPDAQDQSVWLPMDLSAQQPPAPPAFEWHSARQGKRRTVWHHRTQDGLGIPPDGIPLVLLLDGRNWVERMPAAPVLDALTAAGRLPPALYLFIDSIDGRHREEDLTPNPLFWSAVWEELVPLAREIAPVTIDSARRIVAGQSYGGLAALYAALTHPERWGGALAQSPSLWWPDDSLPRGRTRRPGAEGDLTRKLRAGAFPIGHLRIFMEVGRREDVMIDVARTMHDALGLAGHETHYREFEGGHDALCWRGGLIDGLCRLLAPPFPSAPNNQGDTPA